MTTVTQKQFRSVLAVLLLAGGLLAYTIPLFIFFMGWGWEEVARSVPSPDLPPIPPVVWDAFLVVISAMVLLTIVAIVLRFLEQRRRASLPTMMDDAEVLRELARLQDVEAENRRYKIRIELAWGTVDALRAAMEAMQEEWLKDHRALATAQETIRLLEAQPAANAVQRQPAVVEVERAPVTAAAAPGKVSWRKAIPLITWLRTTAQLPARATRDQLRVAFEIPEVDWEAFKASVYAVPPLSEEEGSPTAISPATQSAAPDAAGGGEGQEPTDAATDGRAAEATDARTDVARGYWLTPDDILSGKDQPRRGGVR